MKKIYLLLIAVAGVLTAASCAKELVDDSAQVNPGEVTTLTLSFDKTAKTALIDGKTTWLAGDVIRIYNASGKYYQDVTVPDEDTGKADIEVEVKMSDSKYFAIYPVDAANGIESGKPSIKISGNPDGRFASANISAAETPVNGTELRMRNVTAVLAIDVESNNTVEMVQVNAQNAMTGTYSVDLSGESPVLTAKSATKSATIATGAVDGTYYIAVAPGTYAEDFSVTALKGNGGYQTLTSTKSNEVAVNTILKLGKIGDNLTSGLPGEGTESNPYKITNLGEWTAFSASVNLGNTYANKIVALDTDIEEPVKTPVGYYLAADVQFPFSGTFLGNNHTVKLDLDGGSAKSVHYVGLFGLVGDNAVIKDLTVSGKVSSPTGDYVAGIVAYSKLSSASANLTVENCTNEAAVEGRNVVAGILAYGNASAYTLNVKNCKNTGAVTSKGYTAGGVTAYTIYTTVEGCTNTAAVTTEARNGSIYNLPANAYKYTDFDGSSNAGSSGDMLRGTGGISGVLYNSTAKNCVNAGTVSAIGKSGGIVGTIYWSTVDSCTNNGAVSASYGYAGGINGYMWVQGTVKQNENNGTVTGNCAVGGIVGFVNSQERSSGSTYLTVSDNLNKGKVEASKVTTTLEYSYGFANISAAGGIVGAHKCFNRDWINLLRCENQGDVHGEGQGVGGILGYMGNPRNGSDQGYIKYCVNKGNVSSDLYRAGGIAGIIFDRFTTNRFTITNCQNSGKVTAPQVAGGLVGWMRSAYPDATNNNNKFKLYNCLNTGEVALTDATRTQSHTGTLVGHIAATDVQNCYSSGLVSYPESSAIDFTCDGLLFGQLVSYINAKYIYAAYNEAIYNKITTAGSVKGVLYGSTFGTPCVSDPIVMTDNNGEFPTIEVGGKSCTTPLDALNAWVGDSKDYYLWKAGAKGPEFDVK